MDKGLFRSNKIQYFEGVLPEVLNFPIERYRICKQWLKAREGRPLSEEDIQRYKRILMILKEIAGLMEEIKTAIQCDQLNKREIFEKVRTIVVEQLCIEPDLVTLVANFAKDLGTDSLDTVELVMALEATFNIEIPNEIAQTFMTVQQVIDYVSQKVAVAV